jgi:hypothetical protein
MASVGVQVFTSLTEALRQGYQVCGRYEEGYVIRIQTTKGEWAMAQVACKP